MGKKRRVLPILGGVAGCFLILGLFGLTRGNPPTDAQLRADVIRIDVTANVMGDPVERLARGTVKKEMPAVDFRHDQHTLALGNEACLSCHATGDDGLVFLFKRSSIGDRETDREIYHANCMACHAERAAAGAVSGPLSGNCRECHSSGPLTAADWIPLIFNPSLHYRHESAELIPLSADSQTNCAACHHQYDVELRKTVYRQGEEDSCRYCHTLQPAEGGRLARPDRRTPFIVPYSGRGPAQGLAEPVAEPIDKAIGSMSSAAHNACVACHQALSAAHERHTGPLDCAGCHTRQGQEKHRVVENVPRVKRNQPEAVLMTRWLNAVEPAPELVSAAIMANANPVAFDHLAHELSVAQSASCRDCHHNALTACAACHTRTGAPQGDHVSLNQAMHDPASTRSCIGCHQSQAMGRADCAGCHAAGPQTAQQERGCATCHAVDRAALPRVIMAAAERVAVATAGLSARKNERSAMGALPDLEWIPDRVRIDVLKDRYEGVDMPHRKMVLELARRIEGSGLARAFHADALTLCAGCHHQSPADINPPKCASCHGVNPPGPGDGRPALMGAYHNQCIGCHTRMEVEKPAATACSECHPKRIEQ
jgi:hypothetical protein